MGKRRREIRKRRDKQTGEGGWIGGQGIKYRETSRTERRR